MKHQFTLSGLVLICLLLAGCSGGDSPTAPAEVPSVLGSTHSSLSYSVAVEAVELPEKVDIVLTNNSEDTLRCRISCNQDWLKVGRSGITLAADSATTLGIKISIVGLEEGTYRDTICFKDNDTEATVRRIPVKLKMVKNETYLEVDDPDMEYEYLGIQDGYHAYRMECSWKMICHSNGGNSCKVFEYKFYGSNTLEQSVNVLVRPDLPTSQTVVGRMSFYLYTDHAPPLRTSFYIRIGYRALDNEDYLRIDFSN